MKSIVSLERLLGFTLALLLASAGLAQTGLGVLNGTVSDASGAVIPGAQLTLTNQETNIVREAQSSGTGFYQFTAIPLGRYTLTAESTGFSKYETTFELQAGQTLALNPSLAVGSVETVVQVSGAAPVIATTGSDISDVKDAQRIRQLPLNGRAITNLFVLTPGVEGAAGDSGQSGNAPRVNGMKVGSTEMLLDGISLVDRFGGGMARVQPGLDTVQEFRIETIGSSARYSRPATVTLVTKSGTNALHGSAFWTHRNNAAGLRARQRQDGNNSAQYIRNEFGLSAGGPIIKNRTFWFAAYEGMRLRQSVFAGASVPTASMWDGNLDSLIDSNSIQTMVYDPLTTAPNGTRELFPNLQIPTSRISRFGQVMRDQTPLPTLNVDPLIGRNFEAFYPLTTDTNQMTIKGDHRFSDRDFLSARFTRAVSDRTQVGGRFGIPPPGCTNCGGSSRNDSNVYSTMVRWNHVFSPTLNNELQLSNHRSPKSSGTLGDNFNWPDELGLPNPFAVTGWPTICGPEGFLVSGWGCWDGDNRKDEALTAYQIDDNVTWVKGSHSMQFGVKMRQEYNNIRELQQAQGSHDFGSAWTAQFDPVDQQQVSFTGHGLGSTLLGLPTFLSNQANRGYFYFEQFELGAYFQDSWKVSPKLTLELGLRYDRWAPYGEKFNRLVNVDLSQVANQFQVITPGDSTMESLPGILPAQLESWRVRGLTWATANQAGFPDRLVPADNNNFGPRLGVAYRLNDKFVVRASYGEYFWTMPLSQILQTSRTNPPLNLRFTNDVASQQGNVDFYALSRNPAPNDFIENNSVPTDGIVEISSRARSMMPWDVRNWSDNRMQSWHFTIERALGGNTALRLSYLGNHGRDLEQRFSINARESEWNYQARTGEIRPGNPDLRRVNPDWSFRAADHSGFSNSHSLQAEIEKRYSKGVAFQWFYTFNRALTTSDAGGFTSGNGNINATGTGNFEVPAQVQLLGAPNLSYDDRIRLGYFNSGNIPAHRTRWNALIDLPFGNGKKFGRNASGVLDKVIGGWQLATIGTWSSGFWRGVSGGRYLFGDPSLSGDQQLEMTFGGQRQRLFFAGDFDPTLASDVDQQALQGLVAADRGQRTLRPLGPNFDNRLPQQLADGSIRLTTVNDNFNWNRKNFFRGPSFFNTDLSLFKNFYINEDMNLRFTADFFNAFNTPMDVDPNATSGLQDLSRQRNEPRIIQFSLRFTF